MANIDELARVTKCLHCSRDLPVDAKVGTYPGHGFCDKDCGYDYYWGKVKQGWSWYEITTALESLYCCIDAYWAPRTK